MELVTTVLIATIAVIIGKLIWDRHSIQQTWKRLGIPGPQSSSIFFGNWLDILKEGTYPTFARWTKKYGKVFGYYESGQPILVTADPDMAREIFIKQFDNFEQRLLFIDNTKDPLGNLVEQSGEQWKKVRGLSSPTFSAKRMKQMSPLVHKSIDKLMARFNERAEKGEAFDIFIDMKRLTLDVIASVVYSYDSDVFNEEDNVFLQKLIDLFKAFDFQQTNFQTKLRMLMIVLFPSFVYFLRFFNKRAIAPPSEWFLDLAKKMIQDRLDTGEFRADYIQLMLMQRRNNPSNTSGTDTEDDMLDSEHSKMATVLKHAAKKKELTMEEMQGQSFAFIAAGYETTSTTLAYLSYYLAMYPDVQTKLQEEIDEHFPDLKTKPINYETVQNLQYLDMVFCETSRLGSIAQVVTTRYCKHDTDVCGYHIPRGAKVTINMIDVHRNPDHWGPEPVDEFVPERFTKERKGNRHPMAYMPFGGGPRNCIGMRFAIMQSKMEVINMLKRFTVVRCAETQVPLKRANSGIYGPADGVFVKLIKRK